MSWPGTVFREPMAYFEPINGADLYYPPPRNDLASGVTKDAMPGKMAGSLSRSKATSNSRENLNVGFKMQKNP